MTDHTFSVSQANTFSLDGPRAACKRKWAFRQIDGLEKPKHPSAELGTECHEAIERWLRDGIPPDMTSRAGPIVFAGLHLLPPPRTPGLVLEGHFGLEMGGHPWQGYKDMVLHRHLPLVGDHKTSANPAVWGKTPESLPHDPQACLYAADEMYRTGAPACDLQWTYFRTRGTPQAYTVLAQVTRESVEPILDKLCESAEGMSTLLRSGVPAREVEPNPSACSAFGGCEYRDICDQETRTFFRRSPMTQPGTADFLADLARLQNGQGQPPAPAVPTNVPPPQAPPGYVYNTTTRCFEPAPAVLPPVTPTAPAPTAAFVPPIQINPPSQAAPMPIPAVLEVPAAPVPPEAPPAKRGPGRPKKAPVALEGLIPEETPLVVLGTLLDQTAGMLEKCSGMLRTCAELARGLVQ